MTFLKVVILFLLDQGTLAFRPWVAAPKRDLRLQTTGVTIGEQGRGRPPCRAPTWQAVVDAVPDEVLTGIPYVAAGLNTLLLAGFDLPGIPAEYGPYFGLLSVPAAYYSVWLQMQKPQAKIEMMIRAKLKKPYAPPLSNPWTGNTTWAQEVEAFVDKNELRKTLVLVDPSGTAKPDLLDPLFRDKIHVVAPAMDELSLKKGLCEFFGVKDRGVDALAGLIEDGIKFPFGSALLPAKLLVNLASVDDDAKIRSVFREVDLLKRAAGDNVVTIVTVSNGTFVGALPRSLQSALQVLS